MKSRINAAKKELKEKLYKNHSKIIILLGFSIILSSTLEKTANAAINELNLENKQKKSDINKVKNLAIAFLIIPIFMIMLKNIIIESKEKNVLVEYNDNFTNNDLEVIIKIENLNKKDNIKIISSNNEEIPFNQLSNDTISVLIKSNGTYKILINDKFIENINIGNIDKEAPKIIDNSNDGEILKITLEDNLSGIDYERLEVTSQENKIINLINIDKENNNIFIEAVNGTNYFKLFDKVGNSSIYKIEIEKS